LSIRTPLNVQTEGCIPLRISSKSRPSLSLVAALHKFKEERNFLSHRGITDCLDHDGELDHTAAAEVEARLLAIEPEAQRLRIAIHEEANKFRGDLWFEKVPEAK
jgi:hypothetical protein